MLQDPQVADPTLPPPEQNSRRPGDRGIAQTVVTSLLVVLAFGAGWFGNAYVNQANYIPADDVNQHIINQAYTEINKNYVFTSAVDKQKMAYAAINAMVDTLNDSGHSRFETPEEYKQEAGQLNDSKVIGIGVYLAGGGDQPLIITAIMPNSPAAKADLKAGDQITAVNGTAIKGLTLDQVRPLIKGDGKEGSSVTLTIVRPSATPPTPHDVTLVRAEITPPTAVGYTISDLNIAHIQLLDFSANADDELKKAIRDAQAKHVSGIILDLRGNGGGYLDQAVNVTSEFVPAGNDKNVMILKTRTSSETLKVKAGGLATTTPLVILVDKDTASAAEITAGSIAINRPDVQTVGVTTYGTGTVLEPKTLADGSTLILGTGEWRLPNDTSIYHVGYQPQYMVALPKDVVAFTPLSAKGDLTTSADIRAANDTQLLKAIELLQAKIGGATTATPTTTTTPAPATPTP
jgi:carboxyl-terminal processing protease